MIVGVLVGVIVDVIATVIVAVHVNGNATVGVIDTVGDGRRSRTRLLKRSSTTM